MSESRTCPKCSKPKVQGVHGSITQWMSSCACEIVADPAASQAVSVTLCKACGKRIEAGRPGSFTQWIFHSGKCNCATPEPAQVCLDSIARDSAGADAEDKYDEFEIELDPSVFPTDRYKALREIGQGAAGQVFLCHDRLLNTKVAVKCLRFLTAEQLMSFQEEARATSKLSHPNIVKVLNFGITDGSAPYMVMDYIDGISLEKYLADFGPLPASHAVSIAAQVADALAYAHSKGILHRDIKSSNIIIANTGRGDVRVIDFGIAMVKQAHQEPTIVQGRTVVGTPAYMPPDQANGLVYDERSEIYSLGCVLFEALAGEPPFSGDTALEIIKKHATQPPPAISDINPDSDCTEAVESILSRCLAKDQNDRYATMGEVRDACGAADKTAIVQESTDIGAEKENANPSIFEQSSKAADRKVAIAAIAAAVCLTTCIAWFILSDKGEEQAPVKFVKGDHALEIDVGADQRAEAIKKMISKGEREFRISMLWADVTDRDLAVFEHSKTATVIDLSDAPITDAALKYFADTPVERLILNGTNVRTLESIPGEKTLNTLNLDSTHVNDAALQRLNKFAKLAFVNLDNTEVTADGVVKAIGKCLLSELSVRNCPKISLKDIENLRMAFPFARVGERNSMIVDTEIGASWFDQSGQMQKSFDLWKKWYDHSKSHPDPRKSLAVTSLCHMAGCADRMHKWGAARKYLSEAAAINSVTKSSGNRRAIARSYFEHYGYMHDYDSAIPWGMKALEEDVKQNKSMEIGLALMVAESMIIKKRYEEALSLLAKTEPDSIQWVIEIDVATKAGRLPDGIDANGPTRAREALIVQQMRMANCLLYLNRDQEAIDKCNSALNFYAQDPKQEPLIAADLYYIKAGAELRSKKLLDALKSNELGISACKISKNARAKQQLGLARAQKQLIVKAQKGTGGGK